jgi:hypothetical protein
MLIERNPSGEIADELDMLQLGAVVQTAVLATAIDAGAAWVRSELDAALSRADYRTAEWVLRLGVGLVCLKVRLDGAGDATV